MPGNESGCTSSDATRTLVTTAASLLSSGPRSPPPPPPLVWASRARTACVRSSRLVADRVGGGGACARARVPVRVRACARARVCVCARARARACMRACVRARARVRVCVCPCVRARAPVCVTAGVYGPCPSRPVSSSLPAGSLDAAYKGLVATRLAPGVVWRGTANASVCHGRAASNTTAVRSARGAIGALCFQLDSLSDGLAGRDRLDSVSNTGSYRMDLIRLHTSLSVVGGRSNRIDPIRLHPSVRVWVGLNSS